MAACQELGHLLGLDEHGAIVGARAKKSCGTRLGIRKGGKSRRVPTQDPSTDLRRIFFSSFAELCCFFCTLRETAAGAHGRAEGGRGVATRRHSTPRGRVWGAARLVRSHATRIRPTAASDTALQRAASALLLLFGHGLAELGVVSHAAHLVRRAGGRAHRPKVSRASKLLPRRVATRGRRWS